MEPRRARRRRLTTRVAKQRQVEHERDRSCGAKAIADRQDWASRCWCRDTGLWFWSTNRPRSCGCSNRKDGRPRVNRGMCGFGMRDRVYRWRAQVRELNRVLARGYDPDDDAVARHASARSVSKCTGLWQC